MSWRPSRWAILHPLPVLLLFAVLIAAGLLAFRALPVKQYPDTSFPTIRVAIVQDGASPTTLESEVTRPVEDAVSGVTGVGHVLSTVTTGQSTTTIEFAIGTDEPRAADAVRTAIDRLRPSLPQAIEAPVVTRVEADAAPILTWAVAAPGRSDVELARFVDRIVLPRLRQVSGIGEIVRVGGVGPAVTATLRPDRLAALGLDAAAIEVALRRAAVDAPGGMLAPDDAHATIRVMGALAGPNALARLMLPLGDGRSVRFGSIADIGLGIEDSIAFARLDGRPVVGFSIAKTRAASETVVEDGVTAAIADLKTAYPGRAFTRIVSTVDDTRASYDATVAVLVEGMLLAALTVFLFLRSWRSTMIAAVAMPVSLVPTFAVMAAAGFSLNIVTLLALTLVIGVLVDDAIVEIENIEKRIARGETPREAALIGADAIGLAVTSTTFAILAIFLPVSFMPGVGGQYFREFGLTVGVAVLFSLVVARLLTPLMAAWWLSARPHETAPGSVARWYHRLLDTALDRPWRTLALASPFVILSILPLGQLPIGFLPQAQPRALTLDVAAAPNSSPAAMSDRIADLDRRLRALPGVAHVFADMSGANGSVTLVLDRPAESAMRTRLEPVLGAVPDLRVARRGDGAAPAEVEINLAGTDPAMLAAAADQLQRAMRGLPELAHVRPAVIEGASELVARPREASAARLGIDTTALGEALQAATRGDLDGHGARMALDGRTIPIRLRDPDAARRSTSAIAGLPLALPGGPMTRIATVATLELEAAPARIERIDRMRRVTLHADLAGATLGDALAAIEALPEWSRLPAGIHAVVYGEAEQLDTLFASFGWAMLAGVALIFAVMVLLFGDLGTPTIILSALPLSIGGALLALAAGGFALTLPALIGLFMLLGLAAKNSILLVELARQLEQGGASRRTAIVEACRERARPIVMTTLAMAAGMVPAAIGHGEGSVFRQPMAIAVIGGLVSSTLLSLILVPVFFDLIGRMRPVRFGDTRLPLPDV